MKRPGEGAEQVFFQDIKNQFQEKYLSKEVVLSLLLLKAKKTGGFSPLFRLLVPTVLKPQVGI